MRSQIVMTYFFLEVVEASRPPQLGFAIYIRLHFGEFLVAFVAQFGVTLRGDEELLIYIFSILTGIRSLWHFGFLGAPRRGTEHLIIKIKCSEEGLFSTFSPGAFFGAAAWVGKLRIGIRKSFPLFILDMRGAPTAMPTV